MSLPEVWLRGPLTDIPPVVQPVAHALLQAGEEIDVLLADFPDDLLWIKPAGVASVGFHLQHMAGVCDRLLTYACSLPLSKQQLLYLGNEEVPIVENTTITILVEKLHTSFKRVIEHLTTLGNADLIAFKSVGRKKLPSTHLGLMVHIAEHTMRHLGQLIVTVKVLQSSNNEEYP